MVCVAVVQVTYPNAGARIMVFLGGPGTIGPGMVINDEKKDTIRSHIDLEKGGAKFLKKACKVSNQPHLYVTDTTDTMITDVIALPV